MKFALVILATVSLYALPASKSEVGSESIRKEDPKMLNRCVAPGCNGAGNYDSASSTGPVYRCNTCGNRWVVKR